MIVAERYTTNLSKAQGIIPETYELLELWQPGMSGLELKNRVKETGALGKPTHVRMEDVVIRGFSRRYLVDGSKPALWLRRMLERGAARACLRQLMLIYTAEDEEILNLAASESSIPIVHFRAVPEMVLNSIAESAALAKIESFWFGVVVPMPKFPALVNRAHSVLPNPVKVVGVANPTAPILKLVPS